MSKIFNFVRYKTLASGEIDYDNVEKMAREHKPKLILAGYSAYSRDLDYKRFKEIADQVGALTMADIAHIAGLIAAGLMNDPIPIFDVITTTTHKTLRGPRGGMIMCKEELAKAIDKAVFPGFQGGPHENNIAAKAVAFGEALQPEFKEYCRQILKNAKALEKVFKNNDFELCFGGTDNHLLLIDLTNKEITGKEAQQALDEVGITVNKNAIPDDPRPPMNPSGIRLGTPALTTRGFEEDDMQTVGKLIVKTVHNIKKDDKKAKEDVKNTVQELTKARPVYPDLTYLS